MFPLFRPALPPPIRRVPRGVALLALLLAAVPALAAGARRPAARPPARPAAAPDFDREVRPILAESCFACHGFDAGQRRASLRLDTAAGALATLPTGRRALVPGQPHRSEALRRVLAGTMPPPNTRPALTAAQVQTLQRWIAAGAPYREHWSLLPPRRPAPPVPRRAGWVRNPVDAFILARLEREGLSPSPEAPRATLLRRVSLDLTGLPPAPGELDAFLRDPSPRAYEAAVDRLLASPRFGEHLAWTWLDAARYADTNGYQGDRTRTMWPWRDWVVQALNRNMPFDQFTIEQLAGDLLPKATVSQRLATGFHRNHMLNGEGGRIPEESRVDYVVDRVDTTATVWLGLTFGCARCHDHKYDPFSMRDYYRFFAYFNNINETGAVDRGGQANPVLELPTPEQTARIEALRERVAELERRHDAAPEGSPERAAAAAEREAARKELQAAREAVPAVMVMEERPQPRQAHLLLKGAYDRPGEPVSPGVPGVLPSLPAGAPPNRLALARWLVDPAHPLTARVTVNRYWQHLFGVGLVKTAEDFGVQGERPSHPELLDWLATELVRTGWDTKRLLKLLVTSATYRQSSKATPALRERDPENRLLARAPRYRLPSPVLRDQALALGGLLVEKQGGPPVKPYQPDGVWEDATFGQIRYEQDRGEALYRRTLYVFWRRIVAPTTLFDTAARQTCTVRQTRTNSPLHALILLNDPAYVEAARGFAARVLREAPAADASRVNWAFRLATARYPTEAERAVLLRSLSRLRAAYTADPAAATAALAVGESPRDPALAPVEHAAWAGLCSLLLNLDEVLTRE